MDYASANKSGKHICAGIVAHVDAGKTTLSEALLYLNGAIRKAGRVDHKDAFLDTFSLERERGITIFSKQAEFSMGKMQVTLLDTPGHVDFSAEMERTLQVLDYAILVINGADGVQGHTETLWKLLARYKIPTFLFINKMDQPGTDREALLKNLKQRLDEGCVDFLGGRDELFEQIAVTDEETLEAYLENGEVSTEDIRRLIAERKIFPCYFGSALKMTGVEAFQEGFERYTVCRAYPEAFGAKVFKIARDEQGNRLTYMKITGGSLKVKEVLTNRRQGVQDVWEEKADQIRIYSGVKFEAVKEVNAGGVCAVTGLTQTYPGQGLGIEAASEAPMLQPVLTYGLILPESCNVHEMLLKFRRLEEEEPELHIVWNETLGEIHVQVMGEVQIEILKRLILERCGVEVEFGTGNIVYKETIAKVSEGVGHFEPLRHYAEVHLLMEPGEAGSGLVFDSICSEDVLDRNWQRLILTHLSEREHPGVLTGSDITDMKITLAAGRAHLKHTEGGDFRQATYRAVRHGLKQNENILLEPYYTFRLELPPELVGRAMSDVQRMGGTFEPAQTEGETAVITGSAPVSGMRDYPREVTSYSRGRGRIFCTPDGYRPCHNAEEVIAALGYDAEQDTENPTGSVFCSHGAGYYVPWNEVEDHMHIESQLEKWKRQREAQSGDGASGGGNNSGKGGSSGEENSTSDRGDFGTSGAGGYGSWQEEKELEEIFKKTYGERRPKYVVPGGITGKSFTKPKPKREEQYDQYLLVDGYNVIHAWDDLKELAAVNLDGARTKLMDILSNYQGYKKCNVIVVFDAYKLEGYQGDVVHYHNIDVVYTKEAETADQYIEKVVHDIGRKYQVTVATSDGMEQIIIRGQGAALLSSRELRTEVEMANAQIRQEIAEKRQKNGNYLFNYLDDDLSEYMEEIRLGKKEDKKS